MLGRMKYDYCPSFSDVKESLKERSKECFLESNVHGIMYFADPTRPKWERIVWFFLTAASTFTAVAIIILCWVRFNQDPTLTGVKPETDLLIIDFPQIHLCYDWQHLNYSSLDQDQKWVLTQLYNWRWGDSIEVPLIRSKRTTTIANIFRRRGPDCGVALKNCSFRGVEKPCGEYLQKIVTPAGVCCRFPSNNITINEYPWAFEFTPTVYPVRLYLLDKRDNDGPMRLERPVEELTGPTLISLRTFITVPSKDLNYLTRSQRECHYYKESLSFNDCQSNCIAQYLLDKCNCVPWFLHRPHTIECPFVDYPCLEIQGMNWPDCKCSLSCHSTSYVINKIVSTGERRGGSCVVEMPFWPQGLFERTVRYGFLDVLVSSGGIASLFIGYSVLTTVELGYYLSLRAYCGAVLDSTHRKVNIPRIRTQKLKPPTRINVQPSIVCYEYVD